MKIVAKQIDRSDIVFILDKKDAGLPDSAKLLAMYDKQVLKGMEYLDDPVMEFRTFNIPVPKLKYVFEPQRFLLEDKGFRKPEESKLAIEMHRIWQGVFKSVRPIAYGFNFDLIYRTDSVIPHREVLKPFLKQSIQENVTAFGWQFTLTREKGKRSETYFFKQVSPLELSVHVNYHFSEIELPSDEVLQVFFEKCYNDIDLIMDQIIF